MRCRAAVAFVVLLSLPAALAQPYGKPDRDAPGDEMIQTYLAREAVRLDAKLLDGIKTLDDWEQARPTLEGRVSLHAGPFAHAREDAAEGDRDRHDRGDGYVVEKLHYQSRPDST